MTDALYYQRSEVGFKFTGVSANVPNNDVARLMYYLGCVCTVIECEQDSDIRRFTTYNNWANLSIDEQKVLLGVCYQFSPDVFEDKAFFNNDTLCGDDMNDFLEISKVRQQFLAAESIIIAGQTRQVNKIMVYKMQWMRVYYLLPMQGLATKLRSIERRAVTYTTPSTPTYGSTSSSSSIEYERPSKGCCSSKPCIWGSLCGVLFILAFVIAIVVFYLKNKSFF